MTAEPYMVLPPEGGEQRPNPAGAYCPKCGRLTPCERHEEARPLPKPTRADRPARKPRREKASPDRWAKIRAKKCRACLACGTTSGHIHGHHMVGKGAPHFGSDTENNIVGLCDQCHTEYHEVDYIDAHTFDGWVDKYLWRIRPEVMKAEAAWRSSSSSPFSSWSRCSPQPCSTSSRGGCRTGGGRRGEAATLADRPLVERLREEANTGVLGGWPISLVRLLREAADALELQHETDMLLAERTAALEAALEAQSPEQPGDVRASAWVQCQRCSVIWDDNNPEHRVCPCFDRYGTRTVYDLSVLDVAEFANASTNVAARPERSEGALPDPAAVDAHVATVRRGLALTEAGDRALAALDALVAALRATQGELDNAAGVLGERAQHVAELEQERAALEMKFENANGSRLFLQSKADAAVADNARLRAALEAARQDVIALDAAGFDSTRRQVALVAIAGIDAALAGSAGSPPPPEPEAQSAKSADVRAGGEAQRQLRAVAHAWLDPERAKRNDERFEEGGFATLHTFSQEAHDAARVLAEGVLVLTAALGAAESFAADRDESAAPEGTCVPGAKVGGASSLGNGPAQGAAEVSRADIAGGDSAASCGGAARVAGLEAALRGLAPTLTAAQKRYLSAWPEAAALAGLREPREEAHRTKEPSECAEEGTP